MIDQEIRVALKDSLEKKYANTADTLIVDELGVGHGKARIDVAVINGYMHGYELKSDKDSLYRLGEQTSAYNKVFDKITLVSEKRHVFHALKKIPDWWGIEIAEFLTEGIVMFHPIRKPQNNPEVDAISVLELMWKNEALSFLEELDSFESYKYKNKKEIYHYIAEKTSINTIRKRVRDVLRSRLDWRSDELQQLNGD